ncbi:MAG: hypothetical protein ACYCPM_13245 [Acidobacteriaceae bacterium]
MRGVIVSPSTSLRINSAKNPEDDGGVVGADIVWILHFSRRGDLRSE